MFLQGFVHLPLKQLVLVTTAEQTSWSHLAILQFPATKTRSHRCDCKLYTACAHGLEIFQVCIQLFLPPVHSELSMSKSEHLGEIEPQIWQEKWWTHCQKGRCVPSLSPCKLKHSPPTNAMSTHLPLTAQKLTCASHLHQCWVSTKHISLAARRNVFFMTWGRTLWHTHMFRENLTDIVGRFHRNLGFWPCCHKYSLLPDGVHM